MIDNDTPKYGFQNHGFMASNDALSDKHTNALPKRNLENVVVNNDTPEEKLQLQREIGLFSATNLIIGVIIGSGIFVSPSLALERAGSVGLCLVIWAACGVISLLGALCFAELGILMPRSGAEYVYLQEAFGNLHKFWGPLPSFLCSWVYVMVCRPAEVAVIILAFSEYVCQPFEMYFGAISMEYRDLARKLISLIGLALLTFINFISVKVFVRVQNLFTMTKLFACCVVAGAGIYELCRGMWLKVVGNRTLGVMNFIIPLGVAISAFGSALSIQFSIARLCYVAGKEGHMLEAFSYIHMRRLTPAPAVLLQGVLTMIFILAGNIATLIDFASFLIWIFYGLAMVSLLITRKTMKDVERPFKVQ
ncbi:hypothetical protein C0J52_12262 [Blattella germanica]|nr:hypothetical protein C0J52_12262 [Blattella germanica]